MNTLLDSLGKSSAIRLLTGTAGCMLLLVLQNLAIFWQHYAGTTNFLNDFTRIYYPMTAFWITLMQHGILPEWTPFQNMGMPFVLTMQSGIFYAPLWFFTLVKVPFTLHLAAVVQILHVLWGAVGCWVYMRLLGRSKGVALFAAVAFQFFGGFYSNAEHVDIIRAFAFIPWLFWVIHIAPTQHKLLARNWCAPLMLLLFITSAYQGNLVAHLFMLGLFWMMSWITQYLHYKPEWQLPAKLHLQLASLLLLGVALASVYLLPTLMLKSYLVREGLWVGKTMNWPLSYWNSLIMVSDAEGIYINPTMVSAFVTVPVFCLLFFIRREFIKKNKAWVALTLLAAIMASGTLSVFYRTLVNIIPQLGYSRFPSSDYRGIFCFGLIVLASGVLQEFMSGLRCARPLSRVVVCVALCAAMFIFGKVISAEKSQWLMAMALSAVVFLTLVIALRYPVRGKQILTVMIFIELVSGFYFVKHESVYWSTDVVTNDFHQSINLQSPYSVLDVIKHPPENRPACTDMNPWNSSFQGYLLGRFMCKTQDSKTQPREIVSANPAINNFMHQPWQATVVQKENLAACNPETTLRNNGVATPIQSRSYALQDIHYQVKASEDFCFVENELLFPGWSGVIANNNARVEPQSYCGALRSWCLPKGDYEFTAQYRTPGLREGALASALFCLLYIALIVWRFVLNKKPDATG